ncbi:MAG: aldehyde dehydrogenase family protein, partial [Nakamurella sp.]
MTLSIDPTTLPVGDAGVPAAAQRTIRFPYDGSDIGQAPEGTAADAMAAVDAAVAVRGAVAALRSGTRRDILTA